MTTIDPPARWAVAAAWAVPLCVLPSAVWRVSLLAEDDIRMDAEGWYLVTLSVVSVGLAVLTLALVYPVPVPARVAVVPAVTGGLLLVAISVYVGLNAVFGFVETGPVLIGPEESDAVRRPEPGGPVAVAYLPLLLWGPLVLAVARDRWRRR
ncbi:hypothetical protein GCM10009557_28150 [Virgisporangium ochraceum]|uniref:Uncharacterized protein n=1 Tax=Virgisporangium ochraceum TaxID=65505 RepID=A0A8J3ZNB5_9ACTN|nr:hypothetical protein [Virgisporangium ochraceum]GIJ66974.1 hypothetical protein Voc01_018910 [Virgisporangium ochraceum]